MKNIFVVDDDPMIRMLVSEYLQALGHNMTPLTKGQECLELLETAEKLPDLVILDLQMPEMNGIEVLEKIRADNRFDGIPVLLLSANASNCENLSSVQPDSYLEKPFKMQELLSTVETLERRREP